MFRMEPVGPSEKLDHAPTPDLLSLLYPHPLPDPLCLPIVSRSMAVAPTSQNLAAPHEIPAGDRRKGENAGGRQRRPRRGCRTEEAGGGAMAKEAGDRGCYSLQREKQMDEFSAFLVSICLFFLV